MRPVRSLAALAAGLLAPLAAPAQVQMPTVYLSASPKGTDPVKNIDVRPNSGQAYYVVIGGGDNEYRNFRVAVAADAEGNFPLAKAVITNQPVRKGESKLVRLAPAVEPPPAPKAAAGADAAPAIPSGTRVDGRLFLILDVYGDDNVTPVKGGHLAVPVQVRVRPPADYLDPPTVNEVANPQGGVDLIVQVKGKDFGEPPAKVRLDIRPELFSNVDPDSLKEGTYEAVVPSNGTGVLIARNLRLKPGADPDKTTGIFSVSADGYNRAFSYKTNFRGSGATGLDATRLHIGVPKYAQPGKPLSIRLETLRDVSLGESGRLKLLFYRSGVDGETPQVLADKPTLRDESLTVRTGTAGELRLASEVKDWDIPVDTTGVYGRRKLELRIVGAGAVEPAVTDIILDDTPPAGVVLVRTPETRVRGTTLDVTAEGVDPESGIKAVLFYLGDPPGPDGKPAANGAVAEGVVFVAKDKDGKPVPATRVVYTARIDLPDVKGKAKVGVRFVNNVGLVADSRPVTVLLTDPKQPRTVGDIRVKVTQGSEPPRPQPGLTVTLRDAAGQPVDAKETDAKGVAVFTDLKPGPYVVTTVKPADMNAFATKAVAVVADKEATVELEVKRQPSASYPLKK